jgi:hypothetical protein
MERHLDLHRHLGAPVIQTDAGGNVVWRAEYEPSGRILIVQSIGTRSKRTETSTSTLKQVPRCMCTVAR